MNTWGRGAKQEPLIVFTDKSEAIAAAAFLKLSGFRVYAMYIKFKDKAWQQLIEKPWEHLDGVD